MKTGYIIILLVLISISMRAQFKAAFESNITHNQNAIVNRLTTVKEFNRYSDLLPS